jgi:glycogen debranching enzyme
MISPTHEALERAIESLRRNITPMGFSAAGLNDNPLTDNDSNYFAVWSRDGIKTGLWSLCLNDAEITDCFRRTLELMAEHQTEIGQIPANVRIKSNWPDYGGIGDIASIDSVLWFVIGCSRYAAHTGDMDFLQRLYPHIKQAMFWLRAHDSNNCGLIEIPESSDWMDLFPRSYNVLYDEALWYQACADFSVVTAVLDQTELAESYRKLTAAIHQKIVRQFWPTASKLTDARESFSETQFTLGDATYLLAQISPFGFSWRCDVYANLLSALVGLLNAPKMERLFHFLWGVGVNSPYPVKCIYPAVQSGASDWKDYFITNFLNLPDHYHNGGIWPFIGGLWVRFLILTGRDELAHKELERLAEACRQGIYGEWEFNEWLHGQTGRPMGKAHQAWSSASYIAAYKALHDRQTAVDFTPLTPAMFQKDNGQ